MKTMNTNEMLELLKNSKNLNCAGLADRVLSGKTTIEYELKFAGAFMTAVLTGDYARAMDFADTENKAALIGDNPLSKSLWVATVCKSYGMDTDKVINQLKQKKASYIDDIFEIVAHEDFGDCCDVHTKMQLEALCDSESTKEASKKFEEMRNKEQGDGQQMVSNIMNLLGIRIPSQKEVAEFRRDKEQAKNIPIKIKVDRLMEVSKMIGLHNLKTLDDLHDKARDYPDYFEDLFVMVDSIVKEGQSLSNIRKKFELLLASNSREEAVKLFAERDNG